MEPLECSPFDYLVSREEFDAEMAKQLPGVEVQPRVGLGLGPVVLDDADAVAELRTDPGLYGGSWVGGLPTERTPWSVAAEGADALPFVMQLDFADTFNNVGDGRYPEGAPQSGTLAFFHDTTSLGDPEDTAQDRPWRFVWSDLPLEAGDETPALLPAPGNADADLLAPQTPLDIDAIVTLPEPFNAELPDEALRGKYHSVIEEFEYDAWARIKRVAAPSPPTHPGDADFVVEERMSRFLGWGACEDREDQLAPVLEALGTSDRSELVLLLELNPRTFENPGWFHGHPLQVWIRAEDFTAKDFSNTWCLVRTDC